MKKIASSLLLSVLSMNAFADGNYYDQATVLASVPVYGDVSQPRQECWTEYVTETVPVNNYPQQPYPQQPDRSPAGAIVGGITGAIVGNQIGRGTGRAAATGIGAMAGAIIGDRISQQGQPTYQPQPNYGGGYTTQQRPVQKCRTINNTQRVIQGYNVTYQYNGRQFTERMPNDPGVGRTIPIQVNINRSTY